jgi:hypothetical protein
MAVSAYPDKIGLVESLARPGGNVTGLSKRLAGTIRQAFTVTKGDFSESLPWAVLWFPESPAEALAFRDMQRRFSDSGPGDPVNRNAYVRQLQRGIRDRD